MDLVRREELLTELRGRRAALIMELAEKISLLEKQYYSSIAALDSAIRDLSVKTRLTRREAEVAQAYVEGLSCKEAARRLGIKEQTQKNLMHLIRRKLGVAGSGPHVVRMLQYYLTEGQLDTVDRCQDTPAAEATPPLESAAL